MVIKQVECLVDCGNVEPIKAIVGQREGQYLGTSGE